MNNNYLNLIHVAIDSPWKLWNEIWRLAILPLVRIQFYLAGIKWSKSWKIYGIPILQVTRGSKVSIGDHLTLRSTVQSNPLSPFHPVVISTRSKTAEIVVGHHFSMTGGSLVAEDKIIIGDHVMVGANSLIIDTDFHPVDSKKRLLDVNAGKSKPVKIGDNAFIGTQAIILKGVEIQPTSVVGAGQVVR